MKKILSLLRSKWRQYHSRVFLTDTNNNQIWYSSIMQYLFQLHELLQKRLKYESPQIVMVSNNLLSKIVVFMYCFVTSIDLVFISSKFPMPAIIAAIVSRSGTNVLILDKDIETQIKQVERDEGISILKYIKVVITTMQLNEIITEHMKEIDWIEFNKLYKRGLHNIYSDLKDSAKLTILSPGTVSEPMFIHIPYEVLAKSMQIMSFFMGFKAGDKVSVIADIDFFPNIFTVLGFFTGIQYIQPVEEIQSAEDLQDQFRTCNIKPNVLIFSSQKFKLIWDSILLKVYSSKWLFIMSKYRLLAWIPDRFVLRELGKTFGINVKKVHILNEELGIYCLGILRRSKIYFTSSYGYLEQGNFLAFKDPTLFKHKDYWSRPGGTVLLDSDELFSSVALDDKDTFTLPGKRTVGEIIVTTKLGETTRRMLSEDWGVEMPNLSYQGKRKFLYIFGRKYRSEYLDPISLDLLEKMIKDTLIVKDCFLIRDNKKYRLFIEPRDEVLDVHKISPAETDIAIRLIIKNLEENGIKVSKYAIIKFNGMRNVADKLKYYSM